jgi:hypothetical protein
VPGAFVVNYGHQLEIATDGLLRGVEHRAVPDAARPRTSVATFLMPTDDCLVRPAAVTFREFMDVYRAVGARASTRRSGSDGEAGRGVVHAIATSGSALLVATCLVLRVTGRGRLAVVKGRDWAARRT